MNLIHPYIHVESTCTTVFSDKLWTRLITCMYSKWCHGLPMVDQRSVVDVLCKRAGLLTYCMEMANVVIDEWTPVHVPCMHSLGE